MKSIIKTLFLLGLLTFIYISIYILNRKTIHTVNIPYPPFRGHEELPEGFTPLKVASRVKTNVFSELDFHWDSSRGTVNAIYKFLQKKPETKVNETR